MFPNFKLHEGIYFLTQKKHNFSSIYLNVRKKEGRVYSDAMVKHLPYLSKNHIHYREWKFRQKSFERFIKYLSKKKNNQKILDLGCGNGWFSNSIATHVPSTEVIGLDINEYELKQASRIFYKDNLKFAFADIFELEYPVLENEFDLIVLNASLQYFPDCKALWTVLKTFLKSNGEIHILDSPFYNKEDIQSAKQRTIDYYTKLGFPEMIENYFHHSRQCVKEFEVMYTPANILTKKMLRIDDSPFYWFKKHYRDDLSYGKK